MGFVGRVKSVMIAVLSGSGLRGKDYRGAIKGERVAIKDYDRMIAKAKTKHAREVLVHIRDEEIDHLKELRELRAKGFR